VPRRPALRGEFHPANPEDDSMALTSDILHDLVCAVCKGDLVYDEAAATLTCGACHLRYKVVNDVPDMLVDHAEKF
jgi:uncharacterized protein YbaR (Trm112 family)